MRLKDLRWYILTSIILLISFASLSFCLYLPIKGRVVSSMEDLSKETLKANLEFTEDAIENYYKQFITGNYQSIETNFNKTGYIDKMGGNKYLIKEGKDFLNKEGDNTLYVFFYNADPNYEIGGYMPLTTILEYVEQRIVIFSSSGAIKYNTTSTDLIGTMSVLVNNEDFMSFVVSENGHCGTYKISGVEGAIAVESLGDYYFATFIPTEEAVLSIDWVLSQSITFIIIGIIFFIAMLVVIIIGCYKATLLLRIDRRASKTPNSIVIRLDKNGDVIFANSTFKRLEYELDKINIDDFIEVDTGKPIKELFVEKKTLKCYLDKGDKITYFQFTPLAVLSTYYLVGSDISIDYRRVMFLEESNGRHVITGCYNRFALRNRFETVLSNLKVDAAFVEFLITDYIDIITLFGNQTFEELLRQIVKMLNEKFEGMDIYHIKDEQIVVMYPNIDINDVISSVTDMMDKFKRPFIINTNNIYVKFKACICNIKQEEFKTITTVEIERRNNAAYQSIKNFVEKEIQVYDQVLDGVVLAQNQLEEDLKFALSNQNEELVQYLQPQYSLTENRIVGFESLLRWNNPKYFDKSIHKVVELAEKKGYMLELAKIIIENTFSLAKKLEKYDVSISLNLSPIQIIQAGFVSDLIAQFEKYELKTGSIALEITETFLMRNFSLVIEKLNILRKAGFKVHLDDFCTGYSSMKYLKDLPVDSIKIDQEFVKYVNTNKVNKSIVSCIATLARDLNLEVIVEGVENASQRDTVKKLGCRIIQGYLIGKAMTYEEAVELLEKKK